MGRMYVTTFVAVSVSAQQDFFEIETPATNIAIIHSVHLSQVTIVQDTNEEIWQVQLNHGVGSTDGAGGGTDNESPLDVGDAAALSVGGINNTTKMTGGTITGIGNYTWNIRVPFDLIFTPEMRPVVSPGDKFTVELNTTPAGATVCSGTLIFEEIGG